MISHEYRFIFVHAGRTGGSSFERLAGVGITQDERTLQYGNTDFPEKHSDFQYYRSIYPGEFDKYFKFTIVRNPFDRVVSAWLWQSKIVKNTQLPTFRDFILKRPDSTKFSEKFKLTDFTIEDSIEMFDYIGRFEDIENSYKYLCEKLNIQNVNVPHTNKTPLKRYQDYYNEETIELVQQKYAKDLALFGYKFEQ